jgi:hypothetical protein
MFLKLNVFHKGLLFLKPKRKYVVYLKVLYKVIMKVNVLLTSLNLNTTEESNSKPYT